MTREELTAYLRTVCADYAGAKSPTLDAVADDLRDRLDVEVEPITDEDRAKRRLRMRAYFREALDFRFILPGGSSE